MTTDDRKEGKLKLKFGVVETITVIKKVNGSELWVLNEREKRRLEMYYRKSLKKVWRLGIIPKIMNMVIKRRCENTLYLEESGPKTKGDFIM